MKQKKFAMGKESALKRINVNVLMRPCFLETTVMLLRVLEFFQTKQKKFVTLEKEAVRVTMNVNVKKRNTLETFATSQSVLGFGQTIQTPQKYVTTTETA